MPKGIYILAHGEHLIDWHRTITEDGFKNVLAMFQNTQARRVCKKDLPLPVRSILLVSQVVVIFSY